MHLNPLDKLASNAFPVFVRRLTAAVYQPFRLPATWSRERLVEHCARWCVREGIRGALVFGERDSIYFEADGRTTPSEYPPRGGFIVGPEDAPTVISVAPEPKSRRTGEAVSRFEETGAEWRIERRSKDQYSLRRYDRYSRTPAVSIETDGLGVYRELDKLDLEISDSCRKRVGLDDLEDLYAAAVDRHGES